MRALLLAALLASTLSACAARRCAQRIVTAEEMSWTAEACATAREEGAAVALSVHAENLASEPRQLDSQPLVLTYGRASLAEGLAPSTWAGEGSFVQSGELVEVASRASRRFRRTLSSSGDLALANPVSRGEALYLGVSVQSPVDASDSQVDLGEFVVSVSEDGELLVVPGRAPLVR